MDTGRYKEYTLNADSIASQSHITTGQCLYYALNDYCIVYFP